MSIALFPIRNQEDPV
jgi:hypothetical protein